MAEMLLMISNKLIFLYNLCKIRCYSVFDISLFVVKLELKRVMRVINKVYGMRYRYLFVNIVISLIVPIVSVAMSENLSKNELNKVKNNCKFKLAEGVDLCLVPNDIKKRFKSASISEYHSKPDSFGEVVFPKVESIKTIVNYPKERYSIKHIPKEHVIGGFISALTTPDYKTTYNVKSLINGIGEVFNYQEYYNYLIELNGNTQFERNFEKDTRRFFYACWGDCFDTDPEMSAEYLQAFLCKKQKTCITFSYSSFYMAGKCWECKHVYSVDCVCNDPNAVETSLRQHTLATEIVNRAILNNNHYKDYLDTNN